MLRVVGFTIGGKMINVDQLATVIIYDEYDNPITVAAQRGALIETANLVDSSRKFHKLLRELRLDRTVVVDRLLVPKPASQFTGSPVVYQSGKP